MMRKETKIGILFFILSIILKNVGNSFFLGVHMLDFIIGACTALALLFIWIGIVPEDVYNKLKKWKKNRSITKRT